MRGRKEETENVMKKQTEAFCVEYYRRLAARLDNAMKRKGISQAEIIKKCAEDNYFISQATLSKMLHGTTSISLPNVIQICKVLDENVNTILSMDEAPDADLSFDSSSQLITRADHRAFQGYKGPYHCYFYSTISSEDILLHGDLNFSSSSSGRRCIAELKLETGKFYSNGKPITKTYIGDMTISTSMNTAYCTLTNRDIGEICYFLFHYSQINNEELVCRLAIAITASAGDNRLPTAHRMLISREDLEDIIDQYLSGQLLLNGSDILVRKEALEQLKTDPDLPEYFKNNFDKFTADIIPMDFFRISELTVRANPNHLVSSEDKIKFICLLRKYSFAPRYSKIGSKADEFVYQLIKNYKEKAQTKKTPQNPSSPESEPTIGPESGKKM